MRSFLSIWHAHGDLCKHLGIDSNTDLAALRGYQACLFLQIVPLYVGCADRGIAMAIKDDCYANTFFRKITFSHQMECICKVLIHFLHYFQSQCNNGEIQRWQKAAVFC